MGAAPKSARRPRPAFPAATLALALVAAALLFSAAPLGLFQPGAGRPPAPRDIASASTAPLLRVPRRGELAGTVFGQGLSHEVFHTNALKHALADLVRAGGGGREAVAVVGVEWGDEVSMLAEAGFAVHAFEPMSLFHRNMARIVRDNRARWDVRLHQIAMGAAVSATPRNLTYRNEVRRVTERVRFGRLDDYVDEELTVLSIDIQGSELDVLQGAPRLLSSKVGVRSLWVEIMACNKKVPQLMRLLDDNYVLFDFVPWGKPKGSKRNIRQNQHASFLAKDRGQRPAEFGKYFEWSCSSLHRHFQWLQSDILAVRRDLVTPKFMLKLSTLSQDVLLELLEAKKPV